MKKFVEIRVTDILVDKKSFSFNYKVESNDTIFFEGKYESIHKIDSVLRLRIALEFGDLTTHLIVRKVIGKE